MNDIFMFFSLKILFTFSFNIKLNFGFAVETLEEFIRMKTVQVSYSDCEGPLHLDLFRRTVPLNILFCQDYNFYF